MKKILALGLSVALILALGVPAVADVPEGWTPADGACLGEPIDNGDGTATVSNPDVEEVDVPVPAQYAATVTVDGAELDLTGIPGAPGGYIPMRAICEAADGLADYYPEDNQALFFLGDIRFIVDFATLEVQVEFEPVDAKAYLDPAGYTFLPAGLLNGQGPITVNNNPEMDVERYDIVTIPERTGSEALAYAIMDAADMGSLMALDSQVMEEVYAFHMDAYEDLVAYQPMMSAQPSTVIIAQVKDGQMDTAQADFNAYWEAIKATLGFYPATAEAVENAQIVVSPDGVHLMFISTWDSNDKAIELFNAEYAE